MQDLKVRVDAFMRDLSGKIHAAKNDPGGSHDYYLTGYEVDELYKLHNEAHFGIVREEVKSCAACRKRTYDRLEKWWYEHPIG